MTSESNNPYPSQLMILQGYYRENARLRGKIDGISRKLETAEGTLASKSSLEENFLQQETKVRY